jgi:sec-independent protein translocase protein TatC
MSNGQTHYPDPEDMFADTRMSFGDHLEELRTHLWRAIQGFVIAMIFSLFIGKYVVEFIKAPVEHQLHRFYERTSKERSRQMMAESGQNAETYFNPIRTKIVFDPRPLGINPAVKPKAAQAPLIDPLIQGSEVALDGLGMGDAIDRRALKDNSHWVEVEAVINDPRFERQLRELAIGSRRDRLSTLNVTEAFFVYFKVCMLTGFILGSPWIFYQIWSFIAAGLYPHEKRLVNVYLPFSLALFLAGCAVCQFLVIPKAVEALLWFNEWLGLDPDLRLSEWLSFAITMPLVFGISFQTPLVMLFVFKIGILDVETFRAKRRMAWFVMAVFAAIITPTVDAVSMLFLWVPMGLLYELGIWLCAMQGRAEFESPEESERDELVEV